MKIKNMFLIFIFCFFTCIIDVNASHSINYDVRYFNINESNKMTVRGWSMISHADNYGGTGNDYGNTNGSLRTYIAAYAITSNSKWENMISDVTQSNKNIIFANSCKLIKAGETLNEDASYFGDKRCILFETTPYNFTKNKPVDLFYSRCTNAGCGKRSQRLKNLKNGAERYTGDQCTGGDTNKGYTYTGSHCLYYNVGFNLTFDLKKLYKHFIRFNNNHKLNGNSYYKSIYFRIISDVYVYEGDKATEKSHIMRSTGLGISEYAFDPDLKYKTSGGNHTITNRSLTFNEKIGTNTYKYNVADIKISGIADRIKVTAGRAAPKTKGDLSSTVSPKRYLEINDYYDLDKSRKNGTYSGYTYKKSKSVNNIPITKYANGKSYNYSSKAYAIKGCECSKICNKDDNIKCVCNDCSKDNEKTYYIPTSWARPYGNFTIVNNWSKKCVGEGCNPDDPPPPPDEDPTKCIVCRENECEGSNTACPEPTMSTTTCEPSELKTTSCSDYPTTSQTCTRTIISSGGSSGMNTKKYYYAIKKSTVNEALKTASQYIIDLREKGATNFKLTKKNNPDIAIGTDYYYIPIKFFTDIVYTQKVSINLNNSFTTGMKVKSGRYFPFSLTYTINAGWNKAASPNNRYKNVVRLGYTYTDKNGNVKNSTGKLNFKFILNTSKDNLWVDIDNHDPTKPQERKGDGYLKESQGNKIQFKNVYKHLRTYSDKFRTHFSSYLVDKLSVDFSDSNKISGDTINPGRFENTSFSNITNNFDNDNNQFLKGQSVEATYKYTIRKAFVRRKDGEVTYGVNTLDLVDDTEDITDEDGIIEEDDVLEEEVDEEEVDEEEVLDDEKVDEDDILEEDDSEEVVTEETSEDDSVFEANPNYIDMSKNIYFIPYNMKTNEIFEFTISSENLSLLKRFNFSIDATCEVKANKEKIVYRTIDTSNPFPRADATYSNVAKNWQKYYNDMNGNLSRITENSYKNVSYRTLFLKDSVMDTISALSRNNNVGSYASFNDMDKDGNSYVINNTGIFGIKNGKHCGSAIYNPTECDQVQ